jgi:hypothetical protein
VTLAVTAETLSGISKDGVDVVLAKGIIRGLKVTPDDSKLRGQEVLRLSEESRRSVVLPEAGPDYSDPAALPPETATSREGAATSQDCLSATERAALAPGYRYGMAADGEAGGHELVEQGDDRTGVHGWDAPERDGPQLTGRKVGNASPSACGAAGWISPSVRGGRTRGVPTWRTRRRTPAVPWAKMGVLPADWVSTRPAGLVIRASSREDGDLVRVSCSTVEQLC